MKILSNICAAMFLVLVLGLAGRCACTCINDQMQRAVERDVTWIRGCRVAGYDRARYTTQFRCPDGTTVELRDTDARLAMEYIEQQQQQQ